MEQKTDFSNLFLSHSALIFLKASETRNFSETAKFFRITQSAVSRSMREWEKSWGCPLFDRSSRPISLTAEGRIINQELQKHLKSFLDLADSIRKESNLKPVVRVGCVESLSVDLLPKLILRLRDKTRQIVTILATSNSLHRELLEGKLDIIISSDSTAELSGLNRTLILQEGSLLVLPKSLKDSNCWKSWKGLQFCGLPFIKYHHASGGGKLNDVFMRTAGISVANQIEVDSNSTMLSLIAQGAGWTISRASTILQNKGLMNEILYLPMPEPLLVRKVYVLTRQNEPSALMQEFTQLACSILKESVAPELIKIAPWLEQDIFVLDPTSGVMVDMTGKRAEER